MSYVVDGLVEGRLSFNSVSELKFIIYTRVSKPRKETKSAREEMLEVPNAVDDVIEIC